MSFSETVGMPASSRPVLTCLIAYLFTYRAVASPGELSSRPTFAYSRALLNPDARCPEFLSARHLAPSDGLGHSFMSFNHIILTASAHNVTVKARFVSAGHGQNGSLVDSFFFGDYFDPPVPRGAKTQHIVCPTVQHFAAALARNRAAGCVDGTAILYEITSKFEPCEGHIDPRMYRAAFAHAETFRKSYVVNHAHGRSAGSAEFGGDPAPPAQVGSGDGGADNAKCFCVGVHIRRGDLTHEINRKRFRSRWVPNRAYIQVVDAVYAALSMPPPRAKEPHSVRARKRVAEPGIAPADQVGATMNRSALRLCVDLFVETEGRKSAAEVPDLDPDNTHGFTNFEERLAGYGSVDLVESDPLASFARACSSDILITAKSGYSHLISLLCGSPIILAFPFWHSYADIPNAMMVEPVGRGPQTEGGGPTFIDGATIDEAKFQGLVAKSGLVW